MGTIFQQVLDLITNNPGNLVYHFVLAFSIVGALQAALNYWRGDEFPQGRRMVIGLGLLLGTRLLLFLVGGLAYFGLADPHLILPVSDRGIMLLGLVIIIWLWVFPEPARIADAASGLLGLFCLTVFTLNQVWWSANLNDFAFNGTLTGLAWEILALLLLVLCAILLLIRRPSAWGYGLAMMIVLALGHFFQLFFPDINNDYSGAVRLFEMAGFPLLWAIPNRFNLLGLEGLLKKTVKVEERKRYGVEPETFQAILTLSDGLAQESTCPRLTKLLAETLLADICLIILPPIENGHITIQCGYDLIRQTYFPTVLLPSDSMPMVVSAMERMRSLRLPASSASQDLVNIGQYLDIGPAGHLLASFIPGPKSDETLMGIVLISPYSDRRWSREDQEYLDQITTNLTSVLQKSEQLARNRKELETTKQNLKSFQMLLQETQADNESLKTEMGNISRQSVVEHQTETAALLAQQQESHEIITRLRVENKNLTERFKFLEEKPDTKPHQTVQLEEELKLALTEIAQLQTQLSETESQLYDFQRTVSDPEQLSENQIEVFTSVAQDLRQPMSSIIGYTDLLLGESVGILGALQRKFLERIKASTERMDTLMDDLVQVVTLDTEGLTLRPEAVDLGMVIDEAIVDTRNQLQERRIVVRVDFPEEMPQIIADRDALEQVLIQLLKNAGTATPVNGEIFLRASIYQTDEAQDYVLIQVADQGGGIPKEDIPRVFSRLYRADNPLIQGIGDSGVGLSIVKALVEAHSGRIWVDTELGKGSTFSLLIPLSNGAMTSKDDPSSEDNAP
jgi:signal transduction histidine kinase